MSKKIATDAFEFYVSLGPGRSYQAVAERYTVSKRSVTRHALREGWQERLHAIEAKVREASDQKAQETLEAIRSRHLKGMRFIQAKAIETLKSASLESASDAVRAYTAAVREERVMLGEPSDRTAVSVEDVIKREYERWLVPDGDHAEDAAHED
jgi:transposase